MVRIESFGQGQERRLEFHPVRSSDPAVQSRLECAGSPGEHEIATTFRSSAERPLTYPEGLPFIRGVKAHTNEFPESDRLPRARWSTFFRSRGVFEEVIRQSIGSGWKPDPTVDPPYVRIAARKQFLRRAGHIRRVSEHRFRGFRLVELEDVPDHVIDRLTGVVGQQGG
jgi:hypothetical protein